MNSDHSGNGHEDRAPDAHGHGHAGGAHGHDPHVHEDDRNIIERYIFSTDHKVIGMMYLVTSMAFFFVGGKHGDADPR